MGYTHAVARGQKGYNGVAILSKLPIEDAGDMDFAGLGHARHVAARLENGIVVFDADRAAILTDVVVAAVREFDGVAWSELSPVQGLGDVNFDSVVSSVAYHAGDLFAACMDEDAAETKGSTPIAADLALVSAVASKGDLPEVVAALHRHRIATLFRFGSDRDFEDASRMIADVDQSGLGMPDRDYYLKDDEKSKELQAAYVAHVGRMLELLGDSPETAKAAAEAVMAIETRLETARTKRCGGYRRQEQQPPHS